MRSVACVCSAFFFFVISACSPAGAPISNGDCPSDVCGIGSSAGEDTAFTVQGRNIYISTESSGQSSVRRQPSQTSAQPFFIKGIDYSPTPIGQTPIDSPLKNSNSAIWSRDLPLIRAMGANAIRVYNVTPPPYDQQTGPIYDFLNAAWNNGNSPVYVLMSVFFTGDKLLDSGAVQALAQQYHDLDQKYASYPAVLGVTIGNELGAGEQYATNATWWANFNIIVKAAKKGFADGGDSNKLVLTSENDTLPGSIYYGEQNKAAVDAWGVTVYRGRTFTNLFTQIQQQTTKPVILTEYGTPAAYHPNTGALYALVGALGSCTYPNGMNNDPDPNDVAELPASTTPPSSTPALPNMGGIIDYVTNTASLLYSGFQNGGVVSGGFYFEWTDEWWKANGGNNSAHLGNGVVNGAFPTCFNDEGWYGLNAVSSGTPNALTARPSLSALQQTWAGEP
jgi:hypothetical protein